MDVSLVQSFHLFVKLKTFQTNGSQRLFVDAYAPSALCDRNWVRDNRHYFYSTSTGTLLSGRRSSRNSEAGSTFVVPIYDLISRIHKNSVSPKIERRVGSSFTYLSKRYRIPLCKRCKHANSIVSADPCQDRPKDAIQKSDLNMKAGISIQMCRYRHVRRVL